MPVGTSALPNAAMPSSPSSTHPPPGALCASTAPALRFVTRQCSGHVVQYVVQACVPVLGLFARCRLRAIARLVSRQARTDPGFDCAEPDRPA